MCNVVLRSLMIEERLLDREEIVRFTSSHGKFVD